MAFLNLLEREKKLKRFKTIKTFRVIIFMQINSNILVKFQFARSPWFTILLNPNQLNIV